ncbi:dihydropteroate synthase-like protein [Candidatus Bathyarchaeota archaeon]|nr:dihydropteroate synthase-like protein [Candidatus Bathyarchaeota archaeon]
MKILLVTGRFAEDLVKKYASESEEEIDVVVLPVPIAAFITPDYAASFLRENLTKKYDLIFLPGYVQGDVTPVELATGIKTFKGPIHIADLPMVIDLIDEVKLSTQTPASELIKDFAKKRILESLKKVEENWAEALKEGGFSIGRGDARIHIGRGFPMRVIAEIVNAPVLSEKEIQNRARYYASKGADIIDLGMIANKPMPHKIKKIVESVRSVTNLPLSIDSLNPTEILEAYESGVDLILSLDSGNLDEVAESIQNTPAVVLPTNMKEGRIPRRAEEKVEALLENIKYARDLGLTNVIADPILDPPINPGLFESIRAYFLYRQRDAITPLLFGLGNVIELIDADSQGANCLLASIAQELGANLLFVPEFSSKTFGSVFETSIASKMVFLAEKRKSTPKDLGLDLLILKEKRRREEIQTSVDDDKLIIVEATGDDLCEPDPFGWFRIEVDRENGLISAVHYQIKALKPDIVIKGKRAENIYRKIIEKGLVKKLDHAAYLGKELYKAEIVLKINRSYVQDEELF